MSLNIQEDVARIPGATFLSCSDDDGKVEELVKLQATNGNKRTCSASSLMRLREAGVAAQ
jgi:hypothetical protein